MIAHMVKHTHKNGGFEAVVFTDKHDALDAQRGDTETGSTLAVAWCETNGEQNTELMEVNIIPVNKDSLTVEQVLENLRTAIQDAEQFGLVRTESDQVITGAINSKNGIILK